MSMMQTRAIRRLLRHAFLLAGALLLCAPAHAQSTDANLSGLRLVHGTFNEAFAAATTTYTAQVPDSLARLVAETADAGASLEYVSGDALERDERTLVSGMPSSLLQTVSGETSMLVFKVVAADEVTEKEYTVILTHKLGDVATLSEVDIFQCEPHERFTGFCKGGTAAKINNVLFEPAFSPDDAGTLTYMVTLPHGTPNHIPFTAEATHTAIDDIDISGGGLPSFSTVTPGGGPSRPLIFTETTGNVVELLVTSEDGQVMLNYHFSIVFASAPIAITITPADTSKTKTYGDADPAVDYSVTGLTGGDTKASVFSAAPFDRAPGEVPADYAFRLLEELPFTSVTLALKYAVTLAAGNFTIARKEVTYTTTSADKIYDATTAASDSSASLAGVVGPVTLGGVMIDDTASGKLSVAGCVFADINVGDDKTASGCMLAGESANRYTLSASVSGDITAFTILLTNARINKVYDATTAFTGSDSSVDNTPVPSGDLVIAAITGGVYASADVHSGQPVTSPTFSVRFVTGDARNYIQPTSITVTGSITAKPITLDVMLSKEYDGTTAAPLSPVLSFASGAGLAAGDDDGVKVIFNFAPYSSANVIASTNLVASLAGTKLGNYMLTNANIPASITTKEVTVAAVTLTKPYDSLQ
ncbi:MAG: YDG domain-containing protein, partial [Gammaproteobacteria bacterium]